METIAGAETHIVVDEAGGHAALVRTTMRPIPELPDGTLPLDQIELAFREDDVHDPITGMVALENTHALSMAQPLSVAYTQAVADLAHAHGVPLHIDGARFFNAVVALGTTARELAGARGLGHVLPVEGPRLSGRLDGRGLAGTSSSARAAPASWSAAACARSACWPRAA